MGLLLCVAEEDCGPSCCRGEIRLRAVQIAGLQILTKLLKFLAELLHAVGNILRVEIEEVAAENASDRHEDFSLCFRPKRRPQCGPPVKVDRQTSRLFSAIRLPVPSAAILHA